MHDYQNHKGRDMEKPSLADRELIEEISAWLDGPKAQMGLVTRTYLTRARDALLAHEQQRQIPRCPKCGSVYNAETGCACGYCNLPEETDKPQYRSEQQRSQAAAMPTTTSAEAFDKSATSGPAADTPRDQPAASTDDDLVERIKR